MSIINLTCGRNKEMDRSNPAIRVIMMPKDTNARGTIFGGVILSYIDQAAAVAAYKQSNKNFVTKAMNAVEFVAPVHLGDVVSFYANIVRFGTTSLTVKVDVEAERIQPEGQKQLVKVTAAEVVCVAVNSQGRPIPILDEGPQT
jgi:acyl-CoA thioesterase YciA